MVKSVNSGLMSPLDQRMKVLAGKLLAQWVLGVHEPHRDIIGSPHGKGFQNAATDSQSAAREVIECERDDGSQISEGSEPPVH